MRLDGRRIRRRCAVCICCNLVSNARPRCISSRTKAAAARVPRSECEVPAVARARCALAAKAQPACRDLSFESDGLSLALHRVAIREAATNDHGGVRSDRCCPKASRDVACASARVAHDSCLWTDTSQTPEPLTTAGRDRRATGPNGACPHSVSGLRCRVEKACPLRFRAGPHRLRC